MSKTFSKNGHFKRLRNVSETFFAIREISNLLLITKFSRQTRLSKGESLDGRESYRSNGSRPSVSKSHSFGGYTRGQLSRGDSVTSTHSAGPRLMKQGMNFICLFL